MLAGGVGDGKSGDNPLLPYAVDKVVWDNAGYALVLIISEDALEHRKRLQWSR